MKYRCGGPFRAVLVWRLGGVARFGTPVAQPALGGFGTVGMGSAEGIFGLLDSMTQGARSFFEPDSVFDLFLGRPSAFFVRVSSITADPA